ncbi:unnamed protein product [Lactuca saligna]|uniref:Uncharacterized protein n=1 Tax=Lactuca saligna TaxID=75948 RepID=A0AA35YWU6_LACSI|nr:unnamed protein product [Lactuca saligna]
MDYSPFYSKACQKGFQVVIVQASYSVSILVSSLIFTDLTVPTTSSISTPPKVPIVKSFLEEIRTSGIPSNTYDVVSNSNIGVTYEQPSSMVRPFDHDTDVLFGDDPEPITDFVFQLFSVNFNSDDDDTPMTKAEKQALAALREDIKLNNTDLNLSITQQLTKIQNYLAAEN